MANYMNLEYINKPYLNFLIRYLHFGPNGTIQIYQNSTNIDPNNIIKKYNFLKNI